MHIKQLILEGFKTYKERTEVPLFHPLHNAILGKNGSGKSNLLDAIQFVLSDKYTSAADREKLLYEGAGREIIAATVELIFDNSDTRFPLEQAEISIRRSIGTKKDEYFLNQKHIAKQEIVSLLESAGLSRSNPYYIVQQGKINQLIKMRDSERLELLKEIAGTRTYDERRRESIKIMKDTDSRLAAITDIIQYLEGRLEELEGEKTELRKYQALDTRRRLLEWTVYDKEMQHSSTRLGELEVQRTGSTGAIEQLYGEYAEKRRRREADEEKLSGMEARLKRVNADKKAATNRRKEQLGVEKEREMTVRDAEERLKQEEEKERESRETVRKLQADIQRRGTDGKEDERVYEEKRKEEEEKKAEVRRERARLDDLNAKQGRGAQFSTKRERDAFLQQQRREVERGVREEEKKHAELEREAADTEDKQKRLEAESGKRGGEVEALRQQMDAAKQSIEQLNTRRDALMAQKRELQRDEQQSDDDTAARERREKDYAACMDSDVYRAIQAVNRYTEQHPDIKAGVLGCVVDLFTVAADFNRAVEVSAGAALFHIVVRDDTVASTLIEHLNRTRGGRVTFIPLNRLAAPDASPPKTPDAIPLLDKLRYDAALRPLFASLFGRVLVCRDLATASALSGSYDYTTLTLGGDKIDRKRVITGGYVDAQRSRLAVYKEYKEGRDKAEERRESRRAAAEELAKREAELNRVVSEQHKASEELKRARRRYESMQLDAKHFTATSQGLRDSSNRLRDALKRLDESVAEGRARLAALDAEVRSAFSTDLSADEQRELSTLTRKVVEDEAALAELTKQRVDLEIAKQRGETMVRAVLQRRLDELTAELDGVSMDELREEVERGRRELSELTREREEVDRAIRRLDDEVDALLKDSRRLQADIDRHKGEEARAKAAYNEQQTAMETLRGQTTKYAHKKDECQRKIRELGPLNLAGADRERQKTVKALLRELEELNRALLDFQHVNKKALDQYIALTEQRDDLLERKRELDSSRVSILQLVDHLDQKKDEAIERTFKQIAQHFSAVFGELVEGGKGTLVIQTRRVEDETEEEARERREREREEEEIRRARSRGGRGGAGGRRGRSSKGGEEEEKKEREPSAASAPSLTSLSYTGIGIKVSFTGTAAATHQLSGGQESVVALSLIFAIQRCDPSPFYLFDEIDSALDPVHRAAVAAMIEKQKHGSSSGDSDEERVEGVPGSSSGAQFLTTTFSAEMIDAADQCYGVVFQNKVSKVRLIEKDEALELVRMEEREQREQQGAGRGEDEMKQ